MKKLYCLLLVLMLIFIAGCVKNDDMPQPNTDDEITQAPPEDGDEDTTPPVENDDATVPPQSGGEPATPPTDTPTGDTSKPDTSKPDTSKPDTSKPDTSKPDTSKPDTSKPDTPAKTLTATEVADILKAKYTMSDTIALDESMIADIYGIDMGKIESFSVEIPAASTQAIELAVFKLKDAKEAATIEKALNSRKEDLGKSFDGYIQEQADMARKGSVTSKNGYVVLAIGENAAKIAELFAKSV